MTKIRASEDIMGQLHKQVAETLLEKIASGEAGAAEINAAIKFLQNNGIEANMTPDSTIEKLAAALPKFTDDEDNAYTH